MGIKHSEIKPIVDIYMLSKLFLFKIKVALKSVHVKDYTITNCLNP